MRILLITAICASMLFNCGRKGDANDPSHADRVTQEQKQELTAMKQQILRWAPKCTDNGASFPCEVKGDGYESSGDSMLWMGLLCLSGQTEICGLVPRSFDSDGTAYRSPAKEHWPNGNFSRDMLIGYFAYLVQSPSQSLLATRFHDRVVDSGYLLCDNATDNRCDIGPVQYRVLWAIWGQIWDRMGLEKTFDMEQADLGDDTILSISAYGSPGFQLHLVGTELLLRRKLSTWTNKTSQAANTLRNRQPENPFFEYVAKGPTKRAAELTLKYCPREKQYDSHQWSWQRADYEQAWKASMGWECIFMANLLNQ